MHLISIPYGAYDGMFGKSWEMVLIQGNRNLSVCVVLVIIYEILKIIGTQMFRGTLYISLNF